MYTQPTGYRLHSWQWAKQASIALLCASLILAPGQALTSRISAASVTLNVCRSGCTYTSIQAAIDHAAPGDTIGVAAGAYDEHLTVDKSLTLVGTGPTIVNAGRTGTAITVTAGVSATISGLTVQNGVGNNATPPLNGGGIVNAGTLTVANSTVSKSGGSGGGVFNSGSLMLRRSRVSGNGGSGGGIVSSGTLALFDSVVSDNSSGYTGGIDNSGAATLTDSTVSGNSGAYGTGGIRNSGTLALVRSAVAHNSASRGVGGINNSGTATLTDSTVSGNGANASFGIGGIYNSGALTVTASTVSDNAGTTVGGISNSGTALVALATTIVASNTALSGGPPDCSGAFTSVGYNVIGVAMGCSGLVGGANGDHVGNLDKPLDPRLGPLQDNGGPTPTQALLPGSPAIDAISGDRCGMATDQRGFPRPYPVGGRCDIGAFELGATSDTTDGTATAAAGQTATAAVQQTADASAQQTEIALINAGKQTMIAGGSGTATAAAEQTATAVASIPRTTRTPAPPTSTPIVNGAVASSVTGNSGPYFAEEDVALTITTPLTALRIVVTVRKTPGVSYAGEYNTFWYGEFTSSHSETADAIVYTFELRSGQTIPPSRGLRVAAQFNGDGAPHDYSGDSYTVRDTSAGGTSTTSGTFGLPL